MAPSRAQGRHIVAFALCVYVFCFAVTAESVTVHVPADELTIQAGIDAANSGDTVLVAADTYYEHDIVMKNGVALISESGRSATTVDAQGLGRVFNCQNVGTATTIQGFTITGGYAPADVSPYHGGGMRCLTSSPNVLDCLFLDNSSGQRGGGVFCTQFSSPNLQNVVFQGNSAEFEGGGLGAESNSCPALTDCEFIDNHSGAEGGGVWLMDNFVCAAVFTNVSFHGNSSTSYGGGMFLRSSHPSIHECLFSSNSSSSSGGGIYCSSSSPVIDRTTFSGNSAVNGGVLFCNFADGTPVLENSILSFSLQGGAVSCLEGCSPTLTCCDVYGNAGGDWTGCIADQEGINGNFSEDPLFCTDCYYLQDCSPCVEGYGCGQIGAFGARCPCGGGPSATEETTWSRVKIRF